MLNPTFFDISVFIFLIIFILSVYNNKFPYSKKYEFIVLLTIIIYRVSTYTFLALGGHFGNHATNVYEFDHKWIGAILVPIALIFFRKETRQNNRAIILGLGTGMIIDEISEVLQVFGYPIPLHFRDSVPDLALIIITFAIFIILRRILVKPSR